MKNFSLAELVRDCIDMDELEVALREVIAESIVYEEIAAEIVGDMDITQIVRDIITDCPF